MVLPSPIDITPINYLAWGRYLALHPHPDASWVLNGIKFGFELDCLHGSLVSARKNCPSASAQSQVIDEYLKEEILHHSIAGPFRCPPIMNLHINRFGVIPKSTPGKWRLITDLSFPLDGSVNSLIPDSAAQVRYIGIQEAIDKLIFLGAGALMAKFDIRRAYRLLPIRTADRVFLGMRWRGNYYVDLALPFGLRSAPKIFTKFADVLEFLLSRVGSITHIQHYLDDFFLVGKPNSNECQSALSTCFHLCRELGVPLAEDKTAGPSTVLTFLGVELDSSSMELRLPQGKITKIKTELALWVSKGAGTKRQLLSLIGRLQYCCQAIVLGRPFLRRLIDRSCTVSELHHFVRLSSWEKDDIKWWDLLFREWNGRSLFLSPKWEKAPEIMVTSDAAGSIGFAASFKDNWFAEKWPVGCAELSIAVKEFVPIIISAKIWGFSWKRQRVAFRCDNMAVVSCLKNGTCRDRHLSFLLRELSLLAITLSFTFTAIHIPGTMNAKADALSRFDFQRFPERAPQAVLKPVKVSQVLTNHLLFPPWMKHGKPC